MRREIPTSTTHKKTTNRSMYWGQRVQWRGRGTASMGSVCSAGSNSVCDMAMQPVVSMIHNPSGGLVLSRDFDIGESWFRENRLSEQRGRGIAIHLWRLTASGLRGAFGASGFWCGDALEFR